MYDRPEFTEVHYTFYKPMVEKAASIVHRSAFYIDCEDFEQTLWEWLIRDGHGYILRVKEQRYAEGRELPDGDIEAILIRRAKTVASEELISYRNFQGDYLYQYDEVKRILTEMLAVDSKDIEGHLDILNAYKALRRKNADAADAIVEHYVKDEPATPAIRMRAHRGLVLLTQLANNGKSRKSVEIEEV